MRQEVFIAKEISIETAEKVTDFINDKLGVSSGFRISKNDAAEVYMYCDPENDFFRVDSMLQRLTIGFPEVEFETMGTIQYEPEFIECELCGERLPYEAGRCHICGAPTSPQEGPDEF